MYLKNLIKSLVYPLQQGVKYTYGVIPAPIRYGKIFREMHAFLQESQWWSMEKLEEYQMQKLEKLLRHAYENVPYYHRVFDERCLKPKDIQSLDDFKKLPFTSKEDIKKHGADFLAKNLDVKKLVLTRTGGSTGSPADFYISKSTLDIEKALFWRYWGWHGYNFDDKCAVLRGSYEITPNHYYNPITRHLMLSAFDLTREKFLLYLQVIKRIKPVAFLGYPSLIYLFAKCLLEENIKFEFPFLKVIFISYESSYPYQKEMIQQVFKAKVIEHYGHRECTAFFTKCEEDNYFHVVPGRGYTEFIDVDGKNVDITTNGIAEVVSTGLYEHAFPLIRYRTNDWITLVENTPCKCGRKFPNCVKQVDGRSGDIIKTVSGKYIQPNHLEYAIRYIKHFKDVQIIQHDLTNLEVNGIPYEGYRPEEGEAFKKAILSRIRDKMNVELKLVDKIERPRNQKRRFVISHVPM